MRPLPTLLLCAVLSAVAATADAAVRLPFVFTHHMVLQRDADVPVWGKASVGEEVKVRFGDQEETTVADASGAWRVELAPLSPGEPRELVVEGSQSDEPVVVRDVLVGDVWVCSGQSNMEWSVENSKDGKLALLAADRPSIRLLRVKHLGSQEPRDDIDGAWAVCSSDTARGFSAVGYFFGQQLEETLDVPIGLIDNSWGGSACEAWVPNEKLRANDLYDAIYERWAAVEAEHDEAALKAEYEGKLAEFYEARDKAYAEGKRLPERPWLNNNLFHNHRPANLYNGRVAPLVPLAIKGVIWYQGETNAGRAYQYRDLFPLMISSWREAWGQGEFPFYWVQLADFTNATSYDSDWAELREAQTLTQDKLNNAGEAVIIDLGEANDIHPRNKRDVGLRLARLALSETYGFDVKGSSPRFDSLSVEGSEATVTFSGVGDGLRVFDGGDPVGFAIAGDDRVFHPADAKLVEKDRIVLSSPNVAQPVAVRYAWSNNPSVNLYDSAKLPVTPFRTDDWPGVTAEAR